MNPSHPPTEEALYVQAMELASPSAREAFLLNACGGDATLLGKVRELPACDAEAVDEDFLPTVVTGTGRRTEQDRVDRERPGAAIGDYKLRGQPDKALYGVVGMRIAEGGLIARSRLRSPGTGPCRAAGIRQDLRLADGESLGIGRQRFHRPKSPPLTLPSALFP